MLQAIKTQSSSPQELIPHRLRVLDSFRVELDNLLLVHCPRTASIELFDRLVQRSNNSVHTVANILRHGMSITGSSEPALDAWPRLRAYKLPPPPISVEEICEKSLSAVNEWLPALGPKKYDADILSACVDEVKLGRMRGPLFLVSEVVAQFGSRVAFARRFPVVQSDKVRPCDDFRSGWQNSAFQINRKLVLGTLDSFFAAAVRVRDPKPCFWRIDHESAYRQVPLCENDVGLAVVVVWNPVAKRPEFYAHLAAPFGATAAVYAYNRVARALVHIARTLLLIPVDNFFDDFLGVVSSCCAHSSFHAFRELNEILGFIVKVSKCVPPCSSGELLGCWVDLASRPFTLGITSRRKSSLITLFDSILEVSRLSPTLAGTLAGKVGFAALGLFGRVGRAALRPLYARQHSSNKVISLDPVLRAALLWLRELVCNATPRIFAASALKSPPSVVIYTDGEGSGGIAGVVFGSSCGTRVFQCNICKKVFACFHARKNQIALIESTAALLTLASVAPLIRGANGLLLIDNTSEQGALINGFS